MSFLLHVGELSPLTVPPPLRIFRFLIYCVCGSRRQQVWEQQAHVWLSLGKPRGFCEQENRSHRRSEGKEGSQDREDRKNTGCSSTRIEEEETQRDQKAKRRGVNSKLGVGRRQLEAFLGTLNGSCESVFLSMKVRGSRDFTYLVRV